MYNKIKVVKKREASLLLNTVIFLRPTESLTVFLQQLGRGVRLSEGKECLIVLDFVGQAHINYDLGRKERGKLCHRNTYLMFVIFKDPGHYIS